MATETLRPNAVGSNEELLPKTGPDNYTEVDEAVADDWGTFVEEPDVGWGVDTYGLPDHAVGSGTINHVKVLGRVMGQGSAAQNGKFAVHTHGTTYYGDQFDLLWGAWDDVSFTWVNNPDTTNPWTWAEIDALEAGMAIEKVDSNPVLTQIYVEVDYTPGETYDETGREQVVLGVIGKSDLATFNELGKDQVVSATVGEIENFLFPETGREQVILASQSKGEQLTKVETRAQTILAVIEKAEQSIQVESRAQVILGVIGESDVATFRDLNKLVVVLAVIDGDAYVHYLETDKLQTILAAVEKTEQLVMVETREQIILAAQEAVDLATFFDTLRPQTILAIIEKVEQLVKVESREQVILGVTDETDLATFLETLKLQTILGVVGESDLATFLDTLKEQIVLAVISGDATPLAAVYEEIRTQVIRAVVETVDQLTMTESREQVILAAQAFRLVQIVSRIRKRLAPYNLGRVKPAPHDLGKSLDEYTLGGKVK